MSSPTLLSPKLVLSAVCCRFLDSVSVLDVSGDIEATPVEDIGAMHVAMTICGGDIVWEAA